MVFRNRKWSRFISIVEQTYSIFVAICLLIASILMLLRYLGYDVSDLEKHLRWLLYLLILLPYYETWLGVSVLLGFTAIRFLAAYALYQTTDSACLEHSPKEALSGTYFWLLCRGVLDSLNIIYYTLYPGRKTDFVLWLLVRCLFFFAVFSFSSEIKKFAQSENQRTSSNGPELGRKSS